MSKINTIIKEILYEEKNKKNLKLFYKVDVFIQEFIPPEQEEIQPKTRPGKTQPEPPPTPTGPTGPSGTTPLPTPPIETPLPPAGITASIKNYTGNLLTEDIFKTKGKGEIIVPIEKAENIQTLEDLLDLLSDSKHNIKTKSDDKEKTKKSVIINDLVIEIILGVTGVGNKPIQEIINRGDKLIIDVDYGFNIDNSVGFKVNKMAGSDTLTMSMKKDGKILTGTFDTPTFNKQLIFYRNSLLD